ncbi:hypothetical protein H8D36_00295 [archaeon]|nr:hypothetical protein [archaeon]MBL7057433.1 hypothetical protein [Candidatus Woesearchaeota archaeon]
MDKRLRFAAWAAVVNAIIIIPTFIIGFIAAITDNKALMINATIISSVVFLVTGLLVLYGFYILSNKIKSKFLRVMTYITFGVLIAITVINIVSQFFEPQAWMVVNVILLVIVALTSIFFGIAVLHLKKIANGLATALGVMYIIEGGFILTILLVVLVPLTSLATSILEAILFFKLLKKKK